METTAATCEVCGAPAVASTCDVREADPIPDENGQRWRQWEADGPPHFFCRSHERPAIELGREEGEGGTA